MVGTHNTFRAPADGLSIAFFRALAQRSKHTGLSPFAVIAPFQFRSLLSVTSIDPSAIVPQVERRLRSEPFGDLRTRGFGEK